MSVNVWMVSGTAVSHTVRHLGKTLAPTCYSVTYEHVTLSPLCLDGEGYSSLSNNVSFKENKSDSFAL
jgi:hypothetical protein